jgi:hypothetical protein
MNREAPSWLTAAVLLGFFATFVFWCWIAAAPSQSIYAAGG